MKVLIDKIFKKRFVGHLVLDALTSICNITLINKRREFQVILNILFSEIFYMCIIYHNWTFSIFPFIYLFFPQWVNFTTSNYNTLYTYTLSNRWNIDIKLIHNIYIQYTFTKSSWFIQRNFVFKKYSKMKCKHLLQFLYKSPRSANESYKSKMWQLYSFRFLKQ